MPLTAIDFSQDLATWLAGDGADFDVDVEDDTVSPDPPQWANLARSFVQAQYPFQRAAGLSLKGRAANTTGAIADITAGTTGHVCRRSGTTLGFGTLEAGAFTTGPGIVTPGMLDNGGARSVLGRSANSSGARADISGSGTSSAPQVLTDDGTTASFTAFNTVRAAANVLYEVNFSSLGANTLTDGTEVIDGLNWTWANTAEMGTAAVQNGTGIRLVTATSNGGASGFDTTSQTAVYGYLPLSQLSSYDPSAEYTIEIYMPSLVLETNGETVFLAVWGVAASPYSTSVVRMRVAKIANSAGTRVLRATAQSTPSDSDIAIPTHNVLAIKVGPYGLGQVYSGVWSSGWPTLVAGPTFSTALAAQSPMNTSDIRIALGLGTANDASPTTAVTIERMRIRRA